MGASQTAADGVAVALELDSITAGYGRTIVVREASIAVSEGSVVALLGPNGAGKTTLLRVASALLTADSGAVRLFGEDVTGTAPSERVKRGLCLVPEGRGVFRSLTVSENLLLQTPPWVNEDRLELALAAFPVLRDRLKQNAASLSGGEQQMLALARIYLAQPRVVLLDEISMGLAPRVVSSIFEVLRELAGSGTSIVLVEQYVNRALEIADHVYLMKRGRITFSGAPSELDEHTVLRGYLGTDLDAR